ncbi:hypothetical protein [Kitasatospora sp. NPDC093679]|uniref:hypothetical protein n=1 Tax=Kitasatospora sp. NPDC093679 TaxID=3154983 RepID=UPI003434B41C
MTLLFLIAGASAADAADGSERGGVLAPLNVKSSEGVPLDRYDLQSENGGITDLRSHVCNLLLGAGFALVRILVGLVCWVVKWIFNFPIVSTLTETANSLHYDFFQLMANDLSLWGIFLAAGVAFGLVLVMRGKVGRGLGEIVLTLLLATLVSLPALIPRQTLGPDGPLAQTQQAAHEVGQMAANTNGPDPLCASAEDRDDPSCPMRNILTRTLVVQPYQLLQYGLIPDAHSDNKNIRDLAAVHDDWIHGRIDGHTDCKASDIPILGSDELCPEDQKAWDALKETLKSKGQEGKDAYNFAVNSNWDRVGGVFLVFLAALIVAIVVLSMALVHLGCQFADVIAAAMTSAAMIWAMLPGGNRAALWKWLGVFMTSIVTEFAVSLALPLFALGADGIMSNSQGTVMIQRLLIMDGFAIVVLVFHRRIFAAAGRVGDRFATRMRYAKIGGSAMAGDDSRLGLAMSQAMGGLAPGAGVGLGGGLGLGGFGGGFGAGSGGGGGMQAALLRRSRIGQGLAALADPGLGPMNAGAMAAGAAGELRRGFAALALPARAAHHLVVGSPLSPEQLARRRKPVGGKGPLVVDGKTGQILHDPSQETTPLGHTVHNALLHTRAGRFAIRAGQVGKLGFDLSAGLPAAWERLNRASDRMWSRAGRQWQHYSHVRRDWSADWTAGAKDMAKDVPAAYSATTAGYNTVKDAYNHAWHQGAVLGEVYGPDAVDAMRAAGSAAHLAVDLVSGSALIDTDVAGASPVAGYSAYADVWEHARGRGPEYPFYEVGPSEAELQAGDAASAPMVEVRSGRGDTRPADLGAALGPGVLPPPQPAQVVEDAPGMVVNPVTGEIISGPGPDAAAVVPPEVMRRVSPRLRAPEGTSLEALRLRRSLGDTGTPRAGAGTDADDPGAGDFGGDLDGGLGL